MAQAEQAQFDLVKITNRLINNELKINYQNQTYSALEVTVTDTNGTTQSMFQLSPFHSWRTSRSDQTFLRPKKIDMNL